MPREAGTARRGSRTVGETISNDGLRLVTTFGTSRIATGTLRSPYVPECFWQPTHAIDEPERSPRSRCLPLHYFPPLGSSFLAKPQAPAYPATIKDSRSWRVLGFRPRLAWRCTSQVFPVQKPRQPGQVPADGRTSACSARVSIARLCVCGVYACAAVRLPFLRLRAGSCIWVFSQPPRSPGAHSRAARADSAPCNALVPLIGSRRTSRGAALCADARCAGGTRCVARTGKQSAKADVVNMCHLLLELV